MMFAKAMIQVILASLFIGCLLQVPLGYYQFVRLACFVLFGILAYTEYKKRNYSLSVLCVCSGLLFNPIIQVYLERDIWQGIDKIMASLMILWIMVDTVLLVVQKFRVKSEKFHGAEVIDGAFGETIIIKNQKERFPAEM